MAAVKAVRARRRPSIRLQRLSHIMFLLAVFETLLWFGPVLGHDPTVPIRQEGYCAMYGVCDPRADKNCVNYVEAPVPDFEMTTCPEFQERACCSRQQHEVLQRDIAKASPLFGRCPACIENFRTHFCAYTCSPDQSLFVTIEGEEDGPLGRTANHTVLHLDPDYSEEFWGTCKDVYQPATGTTVFALFGWDRGYEYWFNYMGDPEEFSPFLITYNYTSPLEFNYHGQYPGREEPGPYPCNSPEFPCGCADCLLSCDAAAPPYTIVAVDECKVSALGVELTCLTAAMSGFFCLFLLGYGAFIGVWWTRQKNLESRGLAGGAGSVTPTYGSIAAMTASTRRPTKAEEMFFRVGRFSARRPFFTLIVGLVFIVVLGAGVILLEVETDPINMWVAPSATTFKRKARFEDSFDPFYRIGQIIMTSDPAGDPVVDKFHLGQLLDIQEELRTMVVTYDDGTKSVTLDDICNKPIKGEGCLIQSPLAWFQNDPENFATYETDAEIKEFVDSCSMSTAISKCMSEIGVPQDPDVALGGVPNFQYSNATALVLTYLIDNRPNDERRNLLWEKAFVEFLDNSDYEGVQIAFSTERSVEDELNRDALSDVPTLGISYVLMFVYVGFALGRARPRSLFFVRTRFLLASSGILLVLLSITASVGFFSYLGISATLVIAQVIPFLILSIGLDNQFIIVDAFDKTDTSLPIEDRAGQALASVGVSITAATVSEALAFLLGALTEMPAVQAFTLYAAGSIVIGYFLQMTCYVGFVALDARREQALRLDCLACFKISAPAEYDDVDADKASLMGGSTGQPQRENFVRKFLRTKYAPFLFNNVTRLVVILVFVGTATLSVVLSQYIKLGLDQQVALPRDSYLQEYFDKVDGFLNVGAPTFFVVEDVDYSDVDNQNKVCTLAGCAEDSLGNIINGAKDVPNESYIGMSLNNWLDDYLQWLRFGQCCRQFPDGSYCPPNDQCEGFFGIRCRLCERCIPEEEFKPENNYRPSPEDFNLYLGEFLESTCSEDCGVCGSAYVDNVRIAADNVTIEAVRYMTYHSVLKSQDDFINGLDSVNSISKTVHNTHDVEIYPYSMFYVFFEQYETIQTLALTNTFIALTAILIMTYVLLRDIRVSLLVVLCISMIEADLAGIMVIWNIDLNAISVVNLIMAIGISVEFTVHIGAAYIDAVGSSVECARSALITMGPNTLIGIAMTNCSVLVLAFANSAIMELYYFRMFASIILLGILHGLMFLPVVLSMLPSKGTKVHKDPDFDGVIQQQDSS